MEDSTQPFNAGEYGSSSGEAPGPEQISAAAAQLGRPVQFISDDGYQCELISAAVDSETNSIAYVESRARNAGDFVDVTIKTHLRDPSGNEHSCDIESYNPYFGCDVVFLRWIGDAAILIYNEKHDTYVCRLAMVWPPSFIEIEDRWMINDSILSYIGYKEKHVRRMTFPQLEEMESLSLADAERDGCLPSDPYAG